MSKEKPLSKRGGRREGAGRPRTDSRLFAFRATGKLAEYISSHENKTHFITECIEAVRRADPAVCPASASRTEALTDPASASRTEALTGPADSTTPAALTGPAATTDPASARHPVAIYPATKVKPLSLPYFDISVVAGFPIPLDNDELAQDIELLKMLCPNPESSYLIRVQGESMIEAGIYSDDILIVDKANRHPSEKQVALCELNGEYTIKYVETANGQCHLVPANKDFPVIEVKPSDSFNVWGIVTYIIHKPRR